MYFTNAAFNFYKELLLLLLVSWCFSYSGYGQVQKLKFHHFSSKDGLAHNNITGLFRDRNDFLWISTTDGLSRYDGNTFTTFFHSDKNKYSLCSNNVNTIAEDSHGRLLITNSECVDRYDPARNIFETVFVLPLSSSPANPGTDKILIDNRNHIWVGNRYKLYELDSAYRLLKIWSDEIKGKGQLFSIVKDRKGNIWVNRQGTLNIIDNNSVFNKDVNPHKWPWLNSPVSDFNIDQNDNIWMLTMDYFLEKYSPAGDLIFKIKTNPDDFLDHIIVDDPSKKWITSNGKGLFLFDEKTKKIFQYVHHENEKHSIGFNVSRVIIRDKNNNSWIGGATGLDYISNRQFQLRVWDNFGFDRKLNQNKVEITDFQKCGNRLWVSSWGRGLFSVDMPTGEIRNFPAGKTDLDNFLWNVLFFRGKLWFGNWNGLQSFDPLSNRYKGFTNSAGYSIRHDSVGACMLFKDKADNVWISLTGKNGILFYNNSKNVFEHYDLNQKVVIPGDHFEAMCQDQHNVIWAGQAQSKGLFYYDTIAHSFKELADCNFNDYVNCIISGAGYLWIGTNNGLYKIEQLTRKVSKYGRNEGLTNDIVRTLSIDNNNHLWVGTENGLSVFDMSTSSFICSGIEKELPENEIYKSFCDTTTGQLFFLTPHTVFSFDPEGLQKSMCPLHVVITGFTVMGEKKILPSTAGEPFLLKEDNNFSFEFTAPDFEGAPAMYQYKLEGFDKTWVSSLNRTYAQYNNIPPGDYTFKVKATTDGMHWSELQHPVTLKVMVPFYLTSRFRWISICFLFLLILLAIYGNYRMRLRRILYGQKIRDRISRDMHDDISSGLTKISMMSELLKRKIKTGAPDVESLHDKLISSSRTTIDKLGEIIWATNPQHDNIGSLLSYMRQHITNFFEDTHYKVIVEIPEEFTDRKINSELNRNLLLILKEALNNAVKYAEATEITIRFLLNKGSYYLSVSDNGKGFHPGTVNGGGNGLLNMKKRIESGKGKITIQTCRDAGTAIIVEGSFY